jgi:hypothetical protein
MSLVCGACKQNGKFAQTILATVVDTDTEFQHVSSWVWKVDLVTGLFVEINAKKVGCINESWGD